MEQLKKLWQRIVVVLGAAPTWLLAASTTVTIFSEEIVAVLPDELDFQVAKYATIIVGALTAAITLIRRLTPVLPNERGLLPGPPPEGYSIGVERIEEVEAAEGKHVEG